MKIDIVEIYNSACIYWGAANVFMNGSERVIRLVKMLLEVMLNFEC